MVTVGSEELLQIVIGAGHISERVTVKQAGPVAAGDLLEMGQHDGESRGTAVLVFRHGPEQRSQGTFDSVAIALCGIGQNLGDTFYPSISCAHQGPQRSGLVAAFLQEALQPFEGLG
jgi:hypothetical protein